MLHWWRSLSGARAILLLFALLLLLAGLIVYAWEKNPPDAPNPAATADPEVLVPSSAPPAGAAPASAP